MATITNQPDGGATIDATSISHPTGATIGAVSPTVKTTPDTYAALGDLVGLYAKPDNRDLLIKTYGDQGITGFLQLTGAVNAAATQDEVVYWEEGRRHALVTVSSTSADGDAWTVGANAQPLRDNDVVMGTTSGKRYWTKMTSSASTEGQASFTAVLYTLDGSDADTNDTSLIVIGNLYEQGSVQPTAYMEPELIRRVNPFMIIKEKYKVNGSQATNIGWVNIGNGEYRWYLKGEQETRNRFNDKREMMMLFGQQGIASDSGAGFAGSEGYFDAVEDRGIVVSNANASPLDSIAEFDDIVLQLDKEGAPAEYAMYLNRKQSLAIDDMLASGISTNVTAGLAGQFGAFNNDSDLAVQLGFKSFTRGGYTFHKHDWKLLNDPTLLGATNKFQGAMVPMATVADPKTGNRAPALEMNYKAANGYSREMEHWVTGGGVLGHFNNGDTGEDSATFHYRSEINLITRAANQHVAIKG
jgi:hypothetical protein